MTLSISDLATKSGVRFGTSGVRGLVTQLTDEVAYCYTWAFLEHLEREGELPGAGRVAIAGDLRPSTPRLMEAIAAAIVDRGLEVENSGFVPSPAVALRGLESGIPAIMVTGSHIPADRNGIKFNRCTGEILKRDEQAVMALTITPAATFDAAGNLANRQPLPPAHPAAAQAYHRRYVELLGPYALRGLRIGLYEHSAVGRDLLRAILEELGAEVVRLGRSETFVPVDTEAIRPEDCALALDWTAEHQLDALISTDGDSDRPLLADERGLFLRGDVLGILAARHLGADAVATPVSSNSALEKSGAFAEVRRTRIGSPFVITAMNEAVASGRTAVVGYEANGGFLTATPLSLGGGTLAPLPTRDPLIAQLATLLAAREQGLTLSQLLATLPPRFTASDRLKEFPTERSQQEVARLHESPSRISSLFPWKNAPVEQIDDTDGLRITFADAEVIHLRPSGNAPELRCYTEADTEERAVELCQQALASLEAWR